MRPERLDVDELEAGGPGDRDRLVHGHQLAVGEDVPLDEPALTDGLSRDARGPDLAIPWLRKRPPGRRASNAARKYVGRFARPTCSNIPTDATASNAPSGASSR